MLVEHHQEHLLLTRAFKLSRILTTLKTSMLRFRWNIVLSHQIVVAVSSPSHLICQMAFY